MQMTDEHDLLRHLASIRTVRYWAEFEEFIACHLAARIALYGPWVGRQRWRLFAARSAMVGNCI